MSKLTRRGARNLTATIDRIASVVQDNPALLGIDSRIAKDFAYRCDLISDAIETTAISNYPKAAADFDADEIGEVEAGPLEDGEVEADAAGHFTQGEFSELAHLTEKLAKVASSLAKAAPEGTPVKDHGFALTK